MTDDSRDTPVVLSRIYTRTGDEGTTGLNDGSRVAKTDSRLAAYADTDEANCAIGAAVTLGALPGEMVDAAAQDPERALRLRRRPGHSAAGDAAASTRSCASTRAT